MSLLTAASFLPSWRLFLSAASDGQLHKRIRGRERKIPRVSASASLMRAPVFHRVASSIFRRRSGRNGAGRSLQGQQVFWQFIMNHRHLAECQRCRIIDGNRKLRHPGHGGSCRQCCISVFTPRETSGSFPQHVLSRITELVTATRPDGDNKTPPWLFSGSRRSHCSLSMWITNGASLPSSNTSSSASRPCSAPLLMMTYSAPRISLSKCFAASGQAAWLRRHSS